MREFLNPSAQVANPIDMLGGATPEEYASVLEVLSQDENVDSIFSIYVPTSLVDPADVARAIGRVAGSITKPIFTCFIADETLVETRKILFENQLPMIVYPDEIGAMLGGMKNYVSWLNQKSTEYKIEQHIDKNRIMELITNQNDTKTLGEAATRPLLAEYGIPIIKGALAKDIDEAVVLAKQFGFPVAIKLISADVFHKSDAGGVALNLQDENELRKGLNTIQKNVQKNVPDAKIDGFLIEKMADQGVDVIVGMKRDPNFGPVMMFGLGGIYVELFKDIEFGVLPLTNSDVMRMINNTQAGKLLKGFRGDPPADIDALVDSILRLSQLANDLPEIAEIEINPLRVHKNGKGVCALDARILLA